MNDVNLPLSGGDNPASPERRQLLRAASTLVAGAALFDGVQRATGEPGAGIDPGLHAGTHRDERRRHDQRRQRRQRAAVAAAARRAVDAVHVARRRAATRREFHRHRQRPARLRRQQQAARPGRSFELFEARDGARPSRRHEALRFRPVRRRRPGSRRPRRPPDGARSRRQGHEGRADRHRADLLSLHARQHRLRAGVLSLVQLSAAGTGPGERAAGAARRASGPRAVAGASGVQPRERHGRRRARHVRGLSRGRVHRSCNTTQPISTTRSAARCTCSGPRTARWIGSTTCLRFGASALATSRAKACRAATTCKKARRARCSRSCGATSALDERLDRSAERLDFLNASSSLCAIETGAAVAHCAANTNLRGEICDA